MRLPRRRDIPAAKAQATFVCMPGYGYDFETEALPGAPPQGQNSPRRCAYGLYAEQLSGSPLIAPDREVLKQALSRAARPTQSSRAVTTFACGSTQKLA